MTSEDSSPSRLKVGLLLVPVVLASLVLGAHFLRSGAVAPMLLCLGLPFLLLARRTWAVRVLQAALGLGALSWIWTTLELVRDRQLRGAPYLRMALILGGVALFTAVSGALLELPSLKQALRRRAPGA